jgi:hypothetical protein
MVLLELELELPPGNMLAVVPWHHELYALDFLRSSSSSPASAR